MKSDRFVRILPMDCLKEFKAYKRDCRKVQNEFFGKRLKKRKGCYWYKQQGLKAEPNTPVLFQFDGSVIACARLIDVDPPEQADEEGYRGAFHFEVDSIRVFRPVGPKAIRKIWREFKRFNQTKWKLRLDRKSVV